MCSTQVAGYKWVQDTHAIKINRTRNSIFPVTEVENLKNDKLREKQCDLKMIWLAELTHLLSVKANTLKMSLTWCGKTLLQ